MIDDKKVNSFIINRLDEEDLQDVTGGSPPFYKAFACKNCGATIQFPDDETCWNCGRNPRKKC